MHSQARSIFGGVDFDRGRLFDTTDLDEARERCARVFNPHQLRVIGRGQRLHSRMDHLPLGPLSLNRLTWQAAVEVDPDRLGDYYLISLPTRGHAVFRLDGRPTAVSPACAGVVSSAARFHFEASADFEQIVVRIERSAVENGWLALAGRPALRSIDFACSLPADGASWRAVEPVLQLLAGCARGEFDALRLHHLAARAEDLLVTTLLLHQPHSLGIAAPPAPRSLPLHLRRAEAFMHEHLCEPLTLSTVARACGVAGRTLQTAFQNERGVGPMQWLRRRRLEAARGALLADTSARPSVSQTALRFGFTHLGEFSRLYRQAFGESPSQTTARRR
jgi:AraC-like DNA-binding protein